MCFQIYFNEARHYKNGYSVNITTSPKVDGVTWSLTRNYVHVTHSQHVPEGTLITVTIVGVDK